MVSLRVIHAAQLMRRCHDGTATLTTAEDRIIRVYDKCDLIHALAPS
jgi:hypothetical protein